MNGLRLYFSDFFDVDIDIIENYGAVNISLINDLPLFIDPFLLFNSEKPEYQEIHQAIIKYILFLKAGAERYPTATPGMLSAWYKFSEVKQTWLGFSLSGNDGRGLGFDFARDLHAGLQTVFKDFGNEKVPKSPHMEKLCLISDLVGRDKISDFTTNFAKKYLLDYTAAFASDYLAPHQCAEYTIKKVEFDYERETWKPVKYCLPTFNGDYVLLTPKDILTRDETFINRLDMIRNLEQIAPSVSDKTLRFELNNYFRNVLHKKQKEVSRQEKDNAALSLIREYPELIDYYLKHKEENEEQATSVSKEVVKQVELLFNKQLQDLVLLLNNNTDFYKEEANSYDAAYKRVQFLKTVIEDMDGYRLFYVKDVPIKRESDLQVMYRLVWYASSFDVSREVNNGRGSVDFKISKGSRDITLVEFKLASNTKLRNNLAKQVEVYKAANQTDKAIKVVLFFTDDERAKINTVLNELGLQGNKDIVLIDARNDKVSASNVKVYR